VIPLAVVAGILGAAAVGLAITSCLLWRRLKKVSSFKKLKDEEMQPKD